MEMKNLKKYYAKVCSVVKDHKNTYLELSSPIDFSDCEDIVPGHVLVMCIMPSAFSEVEGDTDDQQTKFAICPKCGGKTEIWHCNGCGTDGEFL